MTSYLVASRDKRWYVFHGEEKLGPYIGRTQALYAAVAMAKEDFRLRRPVRVDMEENGHTVMVYDSSRIAFN